MSLLSGPLEGGDWTRKVKSEDTVTQNDRMTLLRTIE